MFPLLKNNDILVCSKITICPGSKFSMVPNLAVFLDFKGSKGNGRN